MLAAKSRLGTESGGQVKAIQEYRNGYTQEWTRAN
jgi:hypothetical protein